ncbi:MAG: peptidoglycan editing factor PgeF [Frankiales bacterium]|nr:peptidoglycan editing factor PgeF [Frankiales bacterium]
MTTRTGTLGARARWAFADRRGGASRPPYDDGNLADHVGDDPGAVAANRRALAAHAGVDGSRLVAMAPVHGNAVAVVTGPTPGPVPDVDALVTTVPGLALLVLAADCVPVLLADSGSGVVAVVHAGWRGVRSDVVGETLRVMHDLGATPAGLHALVGPAICGRCYGVHEERYRDVVEVAPAAAATSAAGGRGLDLRAAVDERLARAGVAAERHLGCTAETPALYSHYRDGVTGRHGGVVVLEPGSGGSQ